MYKLTYKLLSFVYAHSLKEQSISNATIQRLVNNIISKAFKVHRIILPMK